MPLTISFEFPYGDVYADIHGQYHLTIFCFITGYTGLAKLIVFDDDSGKEYTALTNELGAVSFRVSGRLPQGRKKKNYPLLLTTPDEQERSFFTVEADRSAVRNPTSLMEYKELT